MATILLYNQSRALDLNGFSVNGAQATFRDSGTNRPRTVYANPECTIPHPSPLVADGAGVFPPVYDAGNGSAAVSVTDKDGVMLAGYPIDPVPSVSTDQEGASGISFDPTPQIPVKDVQKAIERVQENIVSPLAAFGLGVTGNAALLADIDAVGIASGFYRFDATTTGTFPSGVVAENEGVVMVYRRSSSDAVMVLIPGTTGRFHVRQLDDTWKSWAWLMSNKDTLADAVWIAGTSTVPAPIAPEVLAKLISRDTRTWQNVTASRNNNTTYRNTTGYTIQVILSIGVSVSGTVLCGPSSGSMPAIYMNSDWDSWPITFDVPDGYYYRLTSGTNPDRWMELR